MLALSDLKTFIRSGGFAWPGGYPCALIMSDGESIDAKSAYLAKRAADHHKAVQAIWGKK